MSHDSQHLTAQQLRAPRTAALAGIIFALLTGIAYALIRLAIPADPADSGDWLGEKTGTVTLALSLVPIAGIAFLWFIGVIRDHLGQREDRFFSSVFFGSGLLYLAMTFVSAALAGALLASYAIMPIRVVEGGIYTFGRAVTCRVSNIYAMRMASVFMFSLGTIWFRTRTMPRLLAFLTYGLAAVLLVVVSYSLWVELIFPAWVLVISAYILVMALRGETGVGDGLTVVNKEEEQS